MQIDHCLILAAGFGTRMGAIGKQLPKVLWPVFEKSLLELQVAYARSLGIKNIYINLHYMGEQIENHCKEKAAFEGVKFLWERPEILDIGGGIHNLALQEKYKGRLLVLNGDQFFYLKKDDLLKYLEPYQDHQGVLLNYEVNSNDGYNALEVSDDRLVKKLIKNNELPRDKAIETYTGISLINLNKLPPVTGVSKFFDSVCPFEKVSIPAVLLKNIDYWDFGTLTRYWNTLFEILKTYRNHSNHPFLRFLVTEKALKTWKIDLQNLAYHSHVSKVINLNPDEENKASAPCILLKGEYSDAGGKSSIQWNKMIEEIK